MTAQSLPGADLAPDPPDGSPDKINLSELFVILVAPNVSEQMGGEAMKAKQIFEELQALVPSTIQVAHARTRAELLKHRRADQIAFVEDEPVERALWRSVVFRGLLNTWFSYRAVRLAERIAAQRFPGRRVIIHQTEPNSPVVPRAMSSVHFNVFGPINGNIYYPPIFRRHESIAARLRRVLHLPLQRLLRLFPVGLKRADLILAAGGQRTVRSLRAAGVPQRVITETWDCGVPDELLARPRVVHRGRNARFLHFGRLVFHKGTALIIESLVHSKSGVTLDVVGRGPELEHCQRLATRLEVEGRVRFLDWYENRSELLDSFPNYRGVVLPSIEDANGIVVQESMAAGLIPICLDWGGPQLLVEHGESGFLIAPTSREHITTMLAKHMDTLADSGEIAEAISIRARTRAEQWRWSKVIRDWVALYSGLLPSPGRTPRDDGLLEGSSPRSRSGLQRR
jgi:glycosyltransferase involved in cell wall biosynthesis